MTTSTERIAKQVCGCVMCICDNETVWNVCELCQDGRHSATKSEHLKRLERLSQPTDMMGKV